MVVMKNKQKIKLYFMVTYVIEFGTVVERFLPFFKQHRICSDWKRARKLQIVLMVVTVGCDQDTVLQLKLN